jgi:hypothetical protein
MILLLVISNLLVSAEPDSTIADPGVETRNPQHTSVNVIATVLFSLGSYSTATSSHNRSAYLTLNESWRSYYTLGFHSLELRREDQGGAYYFQQFFTARVSHLLTNALNAGVHYAYLHENAFTVFPSSSFHIFGMRGTYWLSHSDALGASLTMSISGSNVQTKIAQIAYTTRIVDGLWGTSVLSLSDAVWTSRLLAFRQNISIPFEDGIFLWASGGIGRRVFYFDDELLILYNQREVQTGNISFGASVKIFDQFYILPTLERDIFTDYSVTYGSVGLRAVF